MKKMMKTLSMTLAASLAGSMIVSASAAQTPATERGKAFLEAMSQAGSHYEPNQGQLPEDARYCFRGAAYRLDLVDTGLELRLPDNEVLLGRPMRIQFAGAQAPKGMDGIDPLRFSVMHRVTEDGVRRGLKPIPTYAGVAVDEVYDGVDVRYHTSKGRLEYDFVVAAGADAGQIELALEGTDSMELSAEGDLEIAFPVGTVIHHKPVIYQEVEGKKTFIEGSYVMKENQRVGFKLADYDRNLPLVIDPILTVRIER